MEGDLGAPNASVLGEHSLLVGSSWVAAFLCFIILLTTAGNFLLILLIVTQRSLRNTSNYFLVSLFMSDLMVGLVVMPPAMLNQLYGRWVLRGDFCSLWASFDVMCCSASILNLCVISLDRYLLITSPLRYKLRMTSCRALALILATWSLAALASFLPIKMGWHELEFEVRPLNVTGPGDEDQCRLLVSLPYALVASCLTFFLPSTAISFTYCRILLAARKQAVQVASLTSNVATTDEATPQVPRAPSQPLTGSESRRFSNKHSKKALKASLTLGILLGMFFVAWLPFFVTNVAQVRAWGGIMSGFQKFSLWNPAGFNWRHQKVLLDLRDQGCNSPGNNSKEKNPSNGILMFPLKGGCWCAGETPLGWVSANPCCAHPGSLRLCPGWILRCAHLAGLLQQHHEPHHLPTLHEGLQESHGQIPALLPALGGAPAQRHLPVHEELQQRPPRCHVPQERAHPAG
ncbi:5-hydroxytryptamine receptor 6 isoform X1 [Cyanistes caeruleus]|nr:5-hydroxytryptamine receptor 6 isoform X1 [Cyanistes caeruleus]